MSVSGVLDVNVKEKKHALSITLLSTTDASHLTAKYTLIPTGDAKREYCPINQVWDLKLQ